MTYIKLTRDDGITRNDMHWAVGITNRATGTGDGLCTDGVLHVYDSPEQAAFMRPTHCWDYTRAFEVESDDTGITDGTKRGIKECTVIREIELPKMTTEHRIEIAIRVALLVYDDPAYVKWANNWLSGEDRSRESAATAFDEAVGSAASAFAAGAAEATTVERAAIYAAATADYAVSAAAVDLIAIYAAGGDASDAGGASIRQIDLLSIIKQVLHKEKTK